MSGPRHIEGYAIVSEDGMLADAARVMPDSLKFKADQEFFEHGLDGVDVVVHGRHSHEQQSRSRLFLGWQATPKWRSTLSSPACSRNWPSARS